VETQDLLLALAQRWGRKDLFSVEFATVAGALAKEVADERVPTEKRVSATQRLLEEEPIERFSSSENERNRNF